MLTKIILLFTHNDIFWKLIPMQLRCVSTDYIE